jgi:outer membrane protein
MLRARTLVSFCLCLVPVPLAFAQATTPSTSPVYVTVAFNAAVIQTEEAQHLFKDLQTKFAPRQTHLQQLNTQIDSLKKEINASTAAANDPEKSAKMHTLDTEERQLQREAEDYKGDTDSASQQAFQTVAQKLYAFLQEYAKQRGYMLVIDRGSDAAPVVWYAAANADITTELIKAYDAASSNAHSHTNTHLPSDPKPH